MFRYYIFAIFHILLIFREIFAKTWTAYEFKSPTTLKTVSLFSKREIIINEHIGNIHFFANWPKFGIVKCKKLTHSRSHRKHKLHDSIVYMRYLKKIFSHSQKKKRIDFCAYHVHIILFIIILCDAWVRDIQSDFYRYLYSVSCDVLCYALVFAVFLVVELCTLSSAFATNNNNNNRSSNQ